MGVLIDEVFTEVSTPPANAEGEETQQSESTCAQTAESDVAMCDQIKRLQRRHLRLIAD